MHGLRINTSSADKERKDRLLFPTFDPMYHQRKAITRSECVKEKLTHRIACTDPTRHTLSLIPHTLSPPHRSLAANPS